jgi:hypothetical protein
MQEKPDIGTVFPKFFFALNGRCDAINLDGYKKPSEGQRRNEYLCQTLLRLRERLSGLALTFYVTDSWLELPSYGSTVFAVLRDCGEYFFPVYANLVGGVFKTHPLMPFASLRSGSLSLDISTAARYLRDSSKWLASYWRFLRRAGLGGGLWADNIYPLPLGYARKAEGIVDVDIPKVLDISFAGSVESRNRSRQYLQMALGAPKTISRQRMIHEMERLRAQRPDLKIEIRTTDTFKSSLTDNGEQYLRMLASSKISLVPRGDVFETFRYFEAMSCGSVVVSEPQPSLWFYSGSPAITIRDWRELEKVALPLLNSPDAMMALQKAHVRFWKEVCSEDTLSRYMAEKVLERLRS